MGWLQFIGCCLLAVCAAGIVLLGTQGPRGRRSALAVMVAFAVFFAGELLVGQQRLTQTEPTVIRP